jgi:hypothetical protein
MTNTTTPEAARPELLGPDDYMYRRVQDQIDWYDRKSVWNQTWFKRLRVVEIVAAALIPFLTAIPDVTLMRYVVGGLGVVVTVVAGVIALFQFQERWPEYRATCEALKREQFLFLTGAGPYAGAVAFPTFVQRVEAVLSNENANWAQSVVKPEKDDEPQA